MDEPKPQNGEDAGAQNVCVAVKLRPLVASEQEDGCRESVFVTPGLPQVTTGQHTFTYDHVYGEGGTNPDLLYSRCVAPLVDGLFKGYNATVFAYGQTGSGKTFTMGSEYKPGGKCRGVIPDAINHIFSRIETTKDCAITVRVSFVEIHKEEVKDLLLPHNNASRPAITIRETQSGGVALYGAVEREVRSREEMAAVLQDGTLNRSTASTNMNQRSSRSHAIFSITLEQRRQESAQVSTPMTATTGDGASTQGGDDGDDDDEEAGAEEAEGVEDYLCAKMHLVDLAGSERAKRTKAEGARLKEGIHINRGLLALGNVINAIVDNHKHIPYRDSKLTRLLQDSLGGNSRTVMIACVSPADSNFEESLNTLRYADRARHIRNKPVVNRDPVAAQLAVLRNTVAQLRSENLSLKRALAATGNDGALAEALGGGGRGLGSSALEAVVERLTQENSTLESENLRLKMDMDELRQSIAAVTDKWHTAQAQCDLLRMGQAAAASGLALHSSGEQQAAEGGAGSLGPLPLPGLDIVKGYVSRIAELEEELKSMKSLAHLSFARHRGHGGVPRTPGAPSTPGDLDHGSPGGLGASPGQGDDAHGDDEGGDQHLELVVEEEYFMAQLAAHTLNQEKMKKEVALLQKQLEAKERKMVQLMTDTGNAPALKQQYDRVLVELETQRDKLVAERKALLDKLNALTVANEEERKRLEAGYKERLKQYDEKLKDLRHKEREMTHMEKLKQRTEEAHRRLAADITRIKQQKVAVQKQLEANAKQFATWRQEREKELSQLRKQSRKDRATIQHLEAMQAKQNAVLQRKISDANAARKRIKELEEAKSRRAAHSTAAHQAAAAAAAQQPAGVVESQPNGQAPPLRTDKDRREWLSRELELCNMSCEFRKVIDGELAQRAEASRKLKELEKRLTILDQLAPNSPLLLAAGVPVSPDAAAAAAAAGAAGIPVGPEAREKLLARKQELEDKVSYHNNQITELQAGWERQKAEEESRGQGAMDVRRWTGLKSVVECRELLRTLFRIAVESKCLCNDLTVDMVRYSEEVEVLRVQLEGAQKKCSQYRKLAAALQAAAAHVVSAPHHHTSLSAQDETDKQVDAVLEELHVVTRNNTPAPSSQALRGGSGKALAGGFGPEQAAAAARALAAAEAAANQAALAGGEVGGGDGEADGDAMDVDGDVEMDDASGPGTPSAADAEGEPGMRPKALEFLSPIPSGVRPRVTDSVGTSQRYSPTEGDESDEEEGGAHHDDSEVEEDDGSEEEEEEDEESDDDDNDDDWDPDHATPAIRGGRNASSRFLRRRSTMPANSGSRRNSAAAAAANGNTGNLNGSGYGNGSDASGDGFSNQGTRRRSLRRSASAANTPPSTGGDRTASVAAYEGPVLDDINLKRYMSGHETRLPKLTVAALKEALKGQVIEGQVWYAGSKNRAALIADYRRLMGLPPYPPSVPEGDEDLASAGSGHVLGRGGSQRESAGGASRRVQQLRRSGTGSGGGVGGGAGGSAGGSGMEVSLGGAGPFALRVSPASPATEDSEAFTFSPHTGPSPSNPGAAAASTAGGTPSARRTGAGGGSLNAMGPWARASLIAQTHSARQPTTWASSLRSSQTLAPPGPDALGASGEGPVLTRQGSGSGRASASPVAAPPGVGGSQSARRPALWGSGGSGSLTSAAAAAAAEASGVGSLRDSADFRPTLAPPVASSSPRIARPPLHMATGAATSPRNSLGTPPHGGSLIPRLGSGLKSSGLGGAWSSSPSARDRLSGLGLGGENQQPSSYMMITPTRAAGTPGVVDSPMSISASKPNTPLTAMFKEKAAAARERTAALRQSMQRNWEHIDANHAQRTGSGMAAVPAFGAAVSTSMDGSKAGVRDSSGSAAAAAAAAVAAAHKKAIWR
ncbi:hypothetical protein HYH03_007022 [Edaphochlamys debaryana]|uniref:Kinesin motor domain-containing protein n=1 Tax=Edaphochlamys debaryana TaxID=47281 RepID=A0A835Y2M5_9CHLO|nr:hypothetical protein HYH03_007022 [Edaphochlamys debaryana]|eukprot:KAG2494778.1 hypothetical protein HYH03_007022 [Edaphochlamys debaryana]